LRLRSVLLWFAGVDLRLTLLAIPPIIPMIHRDLHLDESGIAALSNLPVLVLAISSIFGALLTARLGARRALVVGLFVVACSSALRGVGPSIVMLFGMTMLMGVGIAMLQPAFPSLVRAWFSTDKLSLGTSIWANGLLSGEALSASLTIPVVLPLVGQNWERSLEVWSIPVFLTAAAFLFVRDGAYDKPVIGARWFPNFRDARMWQLGAFQAAASLTYFGANTFTPDYLHAMGQPQLIAACLAALNVGQLPASIAVGMLPMRTLRNPITLFIVTALMVAGLFGFLYGDAFMKIAASAMFGIFAAYILTMSFTLPAIIAPHGEVARLSAGTFTLGYSFSFLATLLSGVLWDQTHIPATAFAPILAAAVIVVITGPRLAAIPPAAA
jgi:CP family cyanate transporter-like MFS transporter